MTAVIAESSSRRSIGSRSGLRPRWIRRPIVSSLRPRLHTTVVFSRHDGAPGHHRRLAWIPYRSPFDRREPSDLARSRHDPLAHGRIDSELAPPVTNRRVEIL